MILTYATKTIQIQILTVYVELKEITHQHPHSHRFVLIIFWNESTAITSAFRFWYKYFAYTFLPITEITIMISNYYRLLSVEILKTDNTEENFKSSSQSQSESLSNEFIV